ncbi:cytochrome [Sesamum angolense]|uniref:Cytochrome n=1 Tax=Sesamum angolense TaxID=2727404 RepID=A0AAE1XFE5_9LAMI|nr:cytochrome [Sesamum angolense]
MDPLCLDLSRPPPPLAAAFDSASEISAMRGTAPVFVVWKLKRALNVGLEKDLKEAVKLVHGCVDDMIRSKKETMGGNSGGDLLSRFLESGLDDEMVRDMVISFLMAGRDTTSAAVTWLFWLLTGHREIEKQVVDEITSIKNGGEQLGFDDLKGMNFIKACLCESMRLYPPVVGLQACVRRRFARRDTVYRGNTFPNGMGRMEELWGKDRLEFRPDRWLDENGTVKMVSPYNFQCFRPVPRVCLGKEMAFSSK